MKKNYARIHGIENLHKIHFNGVGKYRMPQILPQDFELPEKWVCFSRWRDAEDPEETGIHFYCDDYKFNALWTHPERFVKMFQRFRCIAEPDFSVYGNMPPALQIYNVYKNKALAAYYQYNGVNVVPAPIWGLKESYEWCFDGEPVYTPVMVSTVGLLISKEDREFFVDGYREMKIRMRPSKILIHGANVPEEIKDDDFTMVESYSKIKHTFYEDK